MIKGKGIPQDYQEALKYYHLAAGQGHTNAQASLGMMYGQGQGTLKERYPCTYVVRPCSVKWK